MSEYEYITPNDILDAVRASAPELYSLVANYFESQLPDDDEGLAENVSAQDFLAAREVLLATALRALAKCIDDEIVRLRQEGRFTIADRLIAILDRDDIEAAVIQCYAA